MGAVYGQVLIAQGIVDLVRRAAQQVFVRGQDRAAFRRGDQRLISVEQISISGGRGERFRQHQQAEIIREALGAAVGQIGRPGCAGQQIRLDDLAGRFAGRTDDGQRLAVLDGEAGLADGVMLSGRLHGADQDGRDAGLAGGIAVRAPGRAAFIAAQPGQPFVGQGRAFAKQQRCIHWFLQ